MVQLQRVPEVRESRLIAKVPKGLVKKKVSNRFSGRTDFFTDNAP